MSERAHRLAQYLEDQHNWNVFDSAPVKSCPSCFKDNMGEDYKYCPHKAGPTNCYCRKPMPGLGVEFIEKYGLDPSRCIMVGDMTSDKTFAKRCGFQYMDQAEFFK